MTKTLTLRQQQVLDYMRKFFLENDQLPPMERLKSHFGWNSNNTVFCVCETLNAKGVIEKNVVGKYRFTREAT